jgi:hypothetical protein
MALSKTYLTVNGKIRSEQRSGESGSRDFVLDGSGSVVGVYRNGWLQADACYEPYGEIYTQWNMGIDGYRFTWGGCHGYRQTGLAYSSVYVRARHYSNKDAAWLSVDQLWPSEMPYGYVAGRVPGNVDLSGKGTVQSLYPGGINYGCLTFPCCGYNTWYWQNECSTTGCKFECCAAGFRKAFVRQLKSVNSIVIPMDVLILLIR